MNFLKSIFNRKSKLASSAILRDNVIEDNSRSDASKKVETMLEFTKKTGISALQSCVAEDNGEMDDFKDFMRFIDFNKIINKNDISIKYISLDTKEIPNELYSFVNLEELKINVKLLSKLDNKILSLSKLEKLVIYSDKSIDIVLLPNIIYEMINLKALEGRCNIRVSPDILKLTNLQVIKNVIFIEEMAKMTSLNSISYIPKYNQKKDYYVCDEYFMITNYNQKYEKSGIIHLLDGIKYLTMDFASQEIVDNLPNTIEYFALLGYADNFNLLNLPPSLNKVKLNLYGYEHYNLRLPYGCELEIIKF